jgi:hypothetical protein
MFDKMTQYIKGKFYPPATQSDLDSDDYSWFKPKAKVYSSGYGYHGKNRINVSTHPVFGHTDIKKSIELYRNYWNDLMNKRTIIVIVCDCVGKCACGKRLKFIETLKQLEFKYYGEIV